MAPLTPSPFAPSPIKPRVITKTKVPIPIPPSQPNGRSAPRDSEHTHAQTHRLQRPGLRPRHFVGRTIVRPKPRNHDEFTGRSGGGPQGRRGRGSAPCGVCRRRRRRRRPVALSLRARAPGGGWGGGRGEARGDWLWWVLRRRALGRVRAPATPISRRV